MSFVSSNTNLVYKYGPGNKCMFKVILSGIQIT